MTRATLVAQTYSCHNLGGLSSHLHENSIWIAFPIVISKINFFSHLSLCGLNNHIPVMNSVSMPSKIQCQVTMAQMSTYNVVLGISTRSLFTAKYNLGGSIRHEAEFDWCEIHLQVKLQACYHTCHHYILVVCYDHMTNLSSSQTVDLGFLYFTFYFHFLFDLFFYFLFLEQLGLGLIGHAVTSVTI